VYHRRQPRPVRAATSNGRYQDPVNLLAKASAVMKRLDRSAEFVRYLEALRAKYKIKRNFIKLVDQKRGHGICISCHPDALKASKM
jgi:hypothetical protein